MALKDDLLNVLPPEVVREIPSGFQVIGDVAVISIPSHLHDYRVLVARAILFHHRNIRTVLHRSAIPRGELRVPDMELLAGDSTVTTCREYGFSYKLDVAQSFYTSKLASERRRVWMQVMPNEKVLVPFAGVGPFAIPPGRMGARVTAVEKNPESCRYLRHNIVLNHVESQVLVCGGDLEEVISNLVPGFDRAILPAPYGYDSALFLVLPLVRSGGVLHFYTFKHTSQIHALEREYSRAGLKIHSIRRCGYVAPGIARYVFDMEKQEKCM